MPKRFVTDNGIWQGGQFTRHNARRAKYIRYADMHDGMRVRVATGPLKGQGGTLVREPDVFPWLIRMDGADTTGYAALLDLLPEV